MKKAMVLVAAFIAAGWSQEAGSTPAKRLESFTWDLTTHKLYWIVTRGTDVDGHFVAVSQDRYEVSPDQALMAFANEKRGITPQEGESLHRLLDTLSVYCAESVVWWEAGEGAPVTDERDREAVPSKTKPRPAPAPSAAPQGKPTKVDQQEDRRKKDYHVADTDNIAALFPWR